MHFKCIRTGTKYPIAYPTIAPDILIAIVGFTLVIPQIVNANNIKVLKSYL